MVAGDALNVIRAGCTAASAFANLGHSLIQISAGCCLAWEILAYDSDYRFLMAWYLPMGPNGGGPSEIGIPAT
jgi:hypothetical protein